MNKPMVATMIDTSATLDSGGLVESLQQAFDASTRVEFEITLSLKNYDGSTTFQSSTTTAALPALPPSADANCTFLQQVYLHLEGARDDATDGSENWIAKEGQFYIFGFQQDHKAFQSIVPRLPLPGLPNSRILYRLETTINLSNLSDKRLYIIDSGLSDYILRV